jgi:hypothetical protein
MVSSAKASVGVSDRPGRVVTACGLLITRRTGSRRQLARVQQTSTATLAALNGRHEPPAASDLLQRPSPTELALVRIEGVRLVGILQGCLKTCRVSDEATAWPRRADAS